MKLMIRSARILPALRREALFHEAELIRVVLQSIREG
jgi:hypothetical protein